MRVVVVVLQGLPDGTTQGALPFKGKRGLALLEADQDRRNNGQLMKLGFAGLGQMGRPMAARLLDAGYELMVYNRTRAAADGRVAG